MRSNIVKIVCPQCHASTDPCKGIKDQREATYCMGKGWIWATRWEDR